MRTARTARPISIAGALLASLLLCTGSAHAGCDVTPSVSDSFRGFLGSVTPPAVTPGLSVQAFARPATCNNGTRSAAADFASPSGCTASGGAACTPLPAEAFAINLAFRPAVPGATPHLVVLRDDCSGFDPNVCGGGGVACIDRSAADPAVFEIATVSLAEGAEERRMSFVFPDTSGLFGPEALAGPLAVAVTRAGDPVPCGLAQRSCRDYFGSSPLVTCADTLYVDESTCTTDAGSVDPVGVAMTALPPANLFADICPQAESPSCRFAGPGAPPIAGAQDAAGNLLVPVDFLGFTGDPNFATLMQGGLEVGGQPIPIPSGDFVETRALRNFATVVPLFEAAPTPGAENLVQGTLDARFIVYRIFNDACSEDAGIPCSLDLECTAACSDELFSPNLPAGLGGAGAVAGACALDANGQSACRVLDSFVDVETVSQASEDNRMGAFTVNECAAQLGNPPALESRNDEFVLDLLDQVLLMRDRDFGLAVQKPTAEGRDGIALTRIQELPFQFGSQDVEGEIAAWLSPELGGCFAGPSTCDRTGNGLVFDHELRAFALDEPGSPTAIDLLEGAVLGTGAVPSNAPGGPVPLRTDLARADGERLVLGAEPGRNVGTAAVQVSDGLVFFRASPFAHRARSTRLVNADGEGGPSSGVAKEPRVSPDGGFVSFTSAAADLGANTGTEQVFLKDLTSDSVLRVSEPNCFQQSEAEESDPNGQSGGGVPSRDGRYIAFWSFASNLVEGDTNDRADVFVRDTTSCDLVRVSVDAEGTQGNDTSLNPWISADGRRVVFESRASNLDPAVPDTNGAFDVFLHDRDPAGDGFGAERETTLVSVATTGGAAGQAASGVSNQAVVSDDGEQVALASTAEDLAPGETNGQVDVFAGAPAALTNASTTDDGLPGDLSSLKPRISGDGRFVSFVSDAALVPEDTNGRRDAYVKDLANGTLRRAGDFRATAECRESVAGLVEFVPDANGLVQDVALSADGALLAYATSSSNLVPNDGDTITDIVVEDLRTGDVALVSATSGGMLPGGASTRPSVGNRSIGFQSQARDLGPASIAPLNAFVNAPADGDADLRPRLGVLDTRSLPPTVRILDLPADHVKAENGAALVVAAGENARLVRESCGGVVGGGLCDASCADTCGLVVEDLLHPAVSDQDSISIDERFACALVTDLLPGGEPVASCHEIGTDPAASLDPLPGPGGSLVPAESVQVRNGRAVFLSPTSAGRSLYEVAVEGGGESRLVQAADKAVLGDEIACFTSFRRDFDPGCEGAACDEKSMFITAPGADLPPIDCQTVAADCTERSCFPALPFSVTEPETCKYITPIELGVEDCVAAGLDRNFDGRCTLLVERCTRVGTTAVRSTGEVVEDDPTSNPVAPDQPSGDSSSGLAGVCVPLVGGVPDFADPRGPCPCSSPIEVCSTDVDPEAVTGVTILNPDSDGDGIPDRDDSCPTRPNLGVDFDADGFDDVCDGFVCGDGLLQRAESCDEGDTSMQPPTACGDGCIPAVRIDLRPPFQRNWVIVGSRLPIGVAILGSELLVPHEDLDMESLVFAASTAGEPCVADPEQGATPLDFEFPFDVNQDGYVDQLVFFRIADANFAADDTQACLAGRFAIEVGPFGEASFEARDTVRVIDDDHCGLGAELLLLGPPLLWLRRRSERRRSRSAAQAE